MELKVNEQGKTKLSYTTIGNEPIHPSVPTKSFPYKFEIPKIDKFKGKEDPREHLRQFKYSCYIISNDDVLMLHTFPMTLAGQALDWYNNLLQHSIYSFEQLAYRFLDHFAINIRKRSSIMDLSKLS